MEAKQRILSQTERERTLAKVKPSGEFESPNRKATRGVQPIKWEDRLGDLDEWRQHKGMGRAIVPVLANSAKTAAVRTSIGNRLKKLHPDESWTTYVNGKFIYLKFGGAKRTHAPRINLVQPAPELFAQSA